MSVLREVVAVLDGRGIRYALIGAAAMAVHGVSRATADVDLLTIDALALRRETWSALESRGLAVRISKGDADDPLAGVVRVGAAPEAVDVVVGRHAWQREQIEAAVRRPIGEIEVPVVTPAGLVLLKLDAGGPKDAWDIRSLLEAAADSPALVAEVDGVVSRLPADARRLWMRIRAGE